MVYEEGLTKKVVTMNNKNLVRSLFAEINKENIISFVVHSGPHPHISCDFIDIKWITGALAGGMKHQCSNCALGKVQMGIIIPFLIEITNEHKDTSLTYEINEEGVIFKHTDKPLLSIDKISLYCNTGTSRKLITKLAITLHTVDGAQTQHLWTEFLPKPSFMQRRKKVIVLNEEVRQIIDDPLYPDVARNILNILMKHLCVGSKKIKLECLKNIELIRFKH